MRTCSRCTQEKSSQEFFDDDRGQFWCVQCCLDFLQAHGGDRLDNPWEDEHEWVYEDASDFVHPSKRTRPWTAAQALRDLKAEFDAPASEKREGFASKLAGDRMVDAVRIPGARALLCTACGEHWGGEHSFKRHRRVRGPDAGRCQTGLDLGLTLRNGVWREESPHNISTLKKEHNPTEKFSWVPKPIGTDK